MNYLKFAAFSFLALGLYYFAQYSLSKKYGSEIVYGIWSIERYGFFKSAHLPVKFLDVFKLNRIYLGIILPLIVSFLSDGRMYFAAVLSSIITINPVHRLKSSFTSLTEFEEAKVAVSGPLSNILLAILIKIFEINALKELMFVNIFIAISYMLPLSGLDGIKVLFGSRYLYVFSMIFILTSALLLNFINGLAALLISLIIALIVLGIYFFRKNKK